MFGVHIDEKFVTPSRTGLYYELNEQMLCWLTEHVGHGSNRGGWVADCCWMWTYRSDEPRGAVMVFTDPHAAMLFKLTWV